MIGFIDWTEERLSLYMFDKKGNQYTLRETLGRDLEGELDQSALSSVVKPNLERVYLSIPSNLLSLRELTFPFVEPEKIKQTLPYELEGILLGNIADYVYDHCVLDSSENSSRILSACIERNRLAEILDLCTSVGIDPAGITSLNLRLSKSNIERLFEDPSYEEGVRAEAAGEELAHPTVNLRQNELSYTGDIAVLRKSLRFTGVLLLVLLLLIFSFTALRFQSLKRESRSLSERITGIYRQVFPEDTKIVHPERQFRANLNSLKKKKSILASIPVLSPLLDISQIDDQNIILSEFNADKDKILIKGTAPAFEDVDAMKNMLSSSFSDVKVIDSQSSPDKKIVFSITMSVNGP